MAMQGNTVSVQAPSFQAQTAPPGAAYRNAYLALLEGGAGAPRTARCLLQDALAQLPRDATTLPPANELESWSASNAAQVAASYRDYLAQRKAGTAPSYFAHRAAAMHFVRSVAPTKLVDGAWLYGTLGHWSDPAFHGLIRTYLEELGDGRREHNHVSLYQALLAGLDEQLPLDLPDDHYLQGAIQLALATAGDDYLPELIGYNLGYEQLPLHLLISAYELNELGIDPYYFTLHVTIDNASTGHAAKAVAAVQALMARAPDPAAFYRRVSAGYALNDLGASTNSVIAGFDLESELFRILAAKSVAGKNLHSDFCKIGGRTVNEWLDSPDNIPAFMQAMQHGGWIARGVSASRSRFWTLIDGPRASMFGVFNPYEKELLRSWIETPATTEATPRRRVASFRALERARQPAPEPAKETLHRLPRSILRAHAPAANDASCAATPGRRFEQELAAVRSKEAMMQLLIAQMSPARHHTPLGLMATRIFAQALDA